MLTTMWMQALNNPLMRNFAKLFAGTAAAKALGFLAMPIIARLITPEDFGEFSVFSAVASVVAPLLALRYVDAIPIPKSASCATHLLTLALMLIVVNSIVLLALACLLLDIIAGAYPFINISFLLLLYCAVVALAVYESLNLWAVRSRNYGVIARTQVSQALAGAVSKVALSYFAVPMALMLGQVTQNFTGISSLLKTRHAPYQKYRLQINLSLLKSIADQFSQYPKYRLLSQMLLVITQALPVLAVGKIFGQAEAGQLGLAFAVVSAPVMIIVGNVRKLYYGEAAKIGLERPEELWDLTRKIMLKMILLGGVGGAALFFLAEPIFVFIFGERWRMAGVISSVYSVYIFSLFGVGAFVDLLNIFNMQRAYLAVNLFRFALVLLTCTLFVDTVYKFVWAYTASLTLVYIFLGVVLFRCLMVGGWHGRFH